MSKHTHEPWPPLIDVCEPATPHPDSNEIVCLGFDDYRRARTCVNACQGIGTDELEQHGLVSAVGYELIELTKQRDELLTALQRLISSDPHIEMFPTSELEICANNEALPPTLREQAASVIQARAVIAMVKGGAS